MGATVLRSILVGCLILILFYTTEPIEVHILILGGDFDLSNGFTNVKVNYLSSSFIDALEGEENGFTELT